MYKIFDRSFTSSPITFAQLKVEWEPWELLTYVIYFLQPIKTSASLRIRKLLFAQPENSIKSKNVTTFHLFLEENNPWMWGISMSHTRQENSLEKILHSSFILYKILNQIS